MNAQPSAAEVRASAARLVSQTLDRGRSLDDLLAADTDEGSARGLKRALCYGTLRWHFRLIEILRLLCARPLEGIAPELRALLEVGLFQLLSGEVAEHAAVAETVGAAKVMGHARAAGFVNAVLRGYLRELDETKRLLAELRTTQPALGWSHPECSFHSGAIDTTGRGCRWQPR